MLFSGWISPYKKQGYPCIPSKDISDQRILQSVWMRVFWPITCEVEFVQIWGSHSEKKNCQVFHFRLLPAKSYGKTLWNLKKTPFWAHFMHFLANSGQSRSFLKNPFLCPKISITVQIFKTKRFRKKKLVENVRIDGSTAKHEFIRFPMPEVQKENPRQIFLSLLLYLIYLCYCSKEI